MFKVDFTYKPMRYVRLEELGWTVRLMGADMGGLEMKDLNGEGPFFYKVNHMHFHAPSEHKFDGIHHDLEMHIVHEI